MGMMKYAQAYEKSIRKIIHETAPKFTLPVTQSRNQNLYDWGKRHQQLLLLNKEKPPKNLYNWRYHCAFMGREFKKQ